MDPRQLKLWGKILLPIALAIAIYLLSSSGEGEPLQSSEYKVLDEASVPLPKRHLQLKELPQAALHLQHVPVVLKEAAVGWKAPSKWTTSYLSKMLGQKIVGYSSNTSLFGPYYDPHKPMAAAFPRPSLGYSPHATLSVQRLLRDRAPGANFSYLSKELDDVNPSLYEDINPLTPLMFIEPSRVSINLWIGQEGVAAHCHYDGYHNFYAQIRGHKTFYLLSPADWLSVGVFPYLHPHHAQCRAQLETRGAQQQLVSRLVKENRTLFKAVLGPGDVLYLPPLWFHHVVANTHSTSVNVWTDDISPEAERCLTRVITRVDALSSSLTRSSALFCALREMLQAHAQPRGFFERLESRYEGLFQRQENRQYTRFKGVDCPVQAITACNLPKQTQELWFGNFVEHILWTEAHGSIKDIASMLHSLSATSL